MIFIKTLASLILLSGVASAGTLFVSGPFSGLNDTDPSPTIEAGQAQDTLNVEVAGNHLSLNVRPGFTNLYTLPVATAPIYGGISFVDTSKNTHEIFANDKFVYTSKNGGEFLAIISTATVGARWSFCEASGKIYGFNDKGDIPFSYDGVTVAYKHSFPLGSVCAVSPTRMLIAGVSAAPNRLYYSEAGNYENFTAGTDPEDPSFDDIGLAGDRITGLWANASEWIIWKTNSMISYQGSNQYDLVAFVVSNKVGLSDPAAKVEHNGILYFKSSNGKIWAYSASGLIDITEKLEVFSSSITVGNYLNNTYSVTPEWSNGTFYNTGLDGDTVIPSSYTTTVTSALLLSSGTRTNISTTSTYGTLVVKASTNPVYFNTTWTQDPAYCNTGYATQTASTVAFNGGVGAACAVYVSKPVSNTEGKWRVSDLRIAGSYTNAASYVAPHPYFCFMTSSADTCPAGNGYMLDWPGGATGAGKDAVYTMRFYVINSGVTTELAASSCSQDYDPGAPSTLMTGELNISRTEAGVWTITYPKCGTLTATNTAYLFTDGYMGIKTIVAGTEGGTYDSNFTGIQVPSGQGTGTYTSEIFDTGITYPSFASLDSSAPMVGVSTAVHSIRTSTSPNNDMWGSWLVVSTYTTNTPFLNRYGQIKSELTCSSGAAILEQLSLQVKATGYWESETLSLNAMTSWGQFFGNEETQNQKHWTYQIKSSTWSNAFTGDSYTDITSSDTITKSTHSVYFKVKAANSFLTTTETVRLQNLNYNYTFYSSSGADLMASAFELNNSIYFSVPYRGITYNTRLMKYDIDIAGWQIYDIPMNAPVVIGDKVHFGSPTNGAIYIWPEGTNDAGSPINAYWKSKDYFGDNAYVNKSFDRLSSLFGRDDGTSVNVGYEVNGSSYSENALSLTATDNKFVRYNYQIPMGTRGNMINLKVGNNATGQPWTFYGATIDYTNESWEVTP